MTSAPLEQEFVFKVDSSAIDEATKAFARGTQGSEDFTRASLSMRDAIQFASVASLEAVKEFMALSDAEMALARANAGVTREEDKHAATSKKAAKETRVFDDAVKHFAGTAKDTGPFAALSSSMERIGDTAASGVKQLLAGALSTAAGFGLYNVGSSVIGFLSELPGKVITASAEAERLDNAFRFSLGPESGQVLGWLENIASKTQFTEDQLKGVVLQMTKVGIPAGDLDKDLAAALDIAAKSANPLEAMSAAVGAFAEGARRGVVNMRMLRPLGIGPEALKVLPEFANMSDKELRKQIEKGNLTRAQLLKVVAGADGQLGDIGIQGGNDMESRLKNLHDLPNLLFQQFYTNPAFDVLKGKLGELYDFFAPGGPGGEAIINFIAKTGEAAADWLQHLDFDEIASDMQDWLEIFSEIGGVAKFLFGVIGDTVGLIKTVVHDLTPIGFLIDKIQDFREGTNEIKAHNKEMAAHAQAFAAPALLPAGAGIPDDEDDTSFLKRRPKVPGVAPALAAGGVAIGGHAITVQNHITVHAESGSSAQEIAEKTAEHVGKTAGGHFLGALQQAKATGGY